MGKSDIPNSDSQMFVISCQGEYSVSLCVVCASGYLIDTIIEVCENHKRGNATLTAVMLLVLLCVSLQMEIWRFVSPTERWYCLVTQRAQ